MSRVSAKFTFDLPFSLIVAENQPNDDLVVPMTEEGCRIVVHPPQSQEEPSSWEEVTGWVWAADRILLDVETDTTSFPPSKDEDERILDVGRKYLVRFLTSCRHRSKQYDIDINWEP